MPRALITGASSGIGAAFARRLRARGSAVVLVGRDTTALRQAVGADAPDAHGSSGVELLRADLTDADGIASVADRLHAPTQPVDLVVHAAGETVALPFGMATLEDERSQARLNVLATLDLLHAAVTAMSGRGGGSVIVVGSTASVWSFGSYAATKAWQANLARAVDARSSITGVRCLLLTPGFTHTNLHARAGVDTSRIPRWMWLDPDLVAAEGLRALDAGRHTWVPSWRYRVLVAASSAVPMPYRTRLVQTIAPLSARNRER